MVDLPKKAYTLGGSKHAMFLMVLGDVAVDPLAISDVKQLADKVMRPVMASQDTISQQEMRVLYQEEEFRNFPFHEIVPANDVLLIG